MLKTVLFPQSKDLSLALVSCCGTVPTSWYKILTRVLGTRTSSYSEGAINSYTLYYKCHLLLAVVPVPLCLLSQFHSLAVLNTVYVYGCVW